jgi:hypothetical protein
LKALVHDGWDAEVVRRQVLESQQRRQSINQALARGRDQAWDEPPHFDATRQYVRKDNARITNARLRYPRARQQPEEPS